MKKINTNEIIRYLNDLFPPKLAAEWDKAGFQIEDVYNLASQDHVDAIITCLDVNLDVVKFAIKNKANLIISRHPFFFEEMEIELNNIAKKEVHQLLLENEIQVFSIHTNYDASDHQNLIELLKLKLNIKEVKRIGESNEGFDIKLLSDITISDFVKKLNQLFNSSNTIISSKINDMNIINRFGICTGSGASMMIYEKMNNCTFVTGEAKWHEFLYANQNNVNLLTFGHYMENYFIDDIKQKIEKTFANSLKVFSFDIKNAWRIF